MAEGKQGHGTYIEALGSIQPIRCKDESCGCGNFHCALCDVESFKPVKTMSQAKQHTTLHWTNRVSHKGKFIVPCLKQCEEGKQHFHCPECELTCFKRNSFVAHLECHIPTEVFNTVAAVISPGLFQHIPGDVEAVLDNVRQSCNVTCNLSGEAWCVIQGKWENVDKARKMLADIIILPVTMEVVAEETDDTENNEGGDSDVTQQNSQSAVSKPQFLMPRKRGRPKKVYSDDIDARPVETEQQNRTEPEQSNQGNNSMSLEENLQFVDNDGEPCRRSSRRRVLSRRFDEYAVPKKLRKTGPGTADYDEFESEEEEEDEENIEIVTVHQQGTPSGQADSNSGENVDTAAGMLLNIEHDDGGGTTVSLTLKDDTTPAVPVRKVVISKSKNGNKCPDCGKMFSSVKKLTSHIEMGACPKSNETVDLKCSKCDYEAHRSFDLKLHFERHHQEKTWECPVCHKKFGPLYDLKTHYKYSGHNGGNKTERAKATCPICSKEIQQKGIQNHIRTVHQNIRPHACSTCGKAFWTKHLLKVHMESHKDKADRVRPYVCEICNQGFFAKMALDDHRTKHAGTPKYACKQCGKQFYHYTGWQRHLVSHTEARPYSCDLCSKTFKTSSNLYAHKQSHGQPAFVCRCGKAYQHKHNLINHARRCPMVGSQDIGETVEVDTISNQRFMCGYCTATFNDFGAVQEHLSQHVASGETDNVQMEGSDLDASMLEHLAVAAAEAGTENLHTLQQLAITAMQHSEQGGDSQTILVDATEEGTAAAILEGQQVLEGVQHEIVNIMVTEQEDQTFVGEVQQMLEVKDTQGEGQTTE